MPYRLQPDFSDDRLAASRYLIAGFDPDQERDEKGRWTSGGGGSDDIVEDAIVVDDEPQIPDTQSEANARAAERLKAAEKIHSKISRSIKSGKQTAEQKLAIDQYQGDEKYEAVNKHLRGITKRISKADLRTVEQLDQAVAESKATKPMTVYRGMTLKPDRINSMFKTGKTFTDKAFVSTAAEKSVAEKFTEDRRRGEKRVILSCEIPKGASALNMPVHPEFSLGGERGEVLLPRGSRFTITSIDHDSDPIFVTMKLSPPKATRTRKIAAALEASADAKRKSRFVWDPEDLDEDDDEDIDAGGVERTLVAAFDPDQERDEAGRWTSSGGGGLIGATIKDFFDQIGEKIRDLFPKRADPMPPVERASAEHHISTASATARELGVDNLWMSSIQKSPLARAEAIREPQKFDERLDRIERSLESSLRFASPSDDRRGVIAQKLDEVRALRRDVDEFRDRHQPEANAFRLGDPSKDPVGARPETRVDRAGNADVADVARQLEKGGGKPETPPIGDRAPHYRTRGAAAKNIQAAAEHLGAGNDAKSAVEHVMKFGSVTKAVAQRYVRAAVKAAAAAADKQISELEQKLKDAGGNPADVPSPAADSPKRDASYWGSDKQPFWRPGKNPTVDNVILRSNPQTGEREVLLIQRAETSHGKPVAEGGKWALPGGFHDSDWSDKSLAEAGLKREDLQALEKKLPAAKPYPAGHLPPKGQPWKPGRETATEAALRELQEETGLDAGELKQSMKQVGSYEGAGRDPRDNAEAWSSSTSFVLELTPAMADKSVAGTDDAKDAKWVPLSKLPPMAFDHAKILQDALDRHASRRLSATYWDRIH